MPNPKCSNACSIAVYTLYLPCMYTSYNHPDLFAYVLAKTLCARPCLCAGCSSSAPPRALGTIRDAGMPTGVCVWVCGGFARACVATVLIVVDVDVLADMCAAPCPRSSSSSFSSVGVGSIVGRREIATLYSVDLGPPSYAAEIVDTVRNGEVLVHVGVAAAVIIAVSHVSHQPRAPLFFCVATHS